MMKKIFARVGRAMFINICEESLFSDLDNCRAFVTLEICKIIELSLHSFFQCSVCVVLKISQSLLGHYYFGGVVFD